ncbi:hypothetical protein PAXINDRAFT_7798 [Paxillus involutus ATCC 200175]|nr:hypothetical protein PAXINDRAFT_7798 [Paxillus involutus ATCC 200175]
MARWCTKCRRSFPTDSGYKKHCSTYHQFSQPNRRPSTFRFHPHLNARSCDENGNFLPPHAEPPPLDDGEDWFPFTDRPSFEFAELQFEKIEASRQEVYSLLKILAARSVLDGSGAEPPFRNSHDLEATIDDILYGETPWSSFRVRRDSHAAVVNMARSADFDGKFDYVPFKEYTARDQRRWSNLMSGDWAYKQEDTIAND